MARINEFINWTQLQSGQGGGGPREWALLKESEDIELLLLKVGAKPAVKLEDLDACSLARLTADAQSAGLAFRAVAQRHGPQPASRGLADPTAGVPHTLYAARQPEVLSQLVQAEAEERLGGRGRRQAQLKSGELLGYPECCRRFFAGLERQDDHFVLQHYQRDSSGSGPPSAASPYLNIFPPLVSPVTWFPCSFSCEASVKVAESRMPLLRKECPPRAELLPSALPGVVVAFDRFAFVLLHEPRRQNGWLHYSSVSDALSFSGAPGLVGSTQARAFRSNVTAPFGQAEAVRITGDAIELGTAGAAGRVGRLLRPASVFRFPAFEGELP